MTVQKQIDRLLAQRASEWMEALRTGGPKEREAFVDWLCESRRHVAGFLTMVALDRELSAGMLKDLVDREELLRRVPSPVTQLPDVTPVRTERLRSRSLPLRWTAGVAAIGIAATMAIWLLVGSPASPQTFSTASDQRAIELSDGSVVQMNAQSQLEVRLHGSRRDLELSRGEALFKVVSDPNRPFIVRTHNATIQAIGTQFNVNAQPTRTTVSVIEGKVRVSAGDKARNSAVGAGEEVNVDAAGAIARSASANVAQAVSWRRQRLVFQKTALEDIVSEFNRYNATPKLRLEGIEAASRHYSATFDADDPESFCEFLAKEHDIVIERRDREIVVRPRQP